MKSLDLATLGWSFLRVGATAFGGLGAALALIDHELVEKRRLVTKTDLTEALTYTKLLPGSTVVQVVAYLGYKIAGWPGSAVSTAAFLVPSVLAMLGLAALYAEFTSLAVIKPTINGITWAVVGILFATTYRLTKTNIENLPALGIAAGAFVASTFFRVNTGVIVVAGGIFGLLLLSGNNAARNEEGSR
jgi:chromate transporter